MQEEVGFVALNVQFVSAFENLFTYNGKQGHEIVLMYEGESRMSLSIAKSDLCLWKERGKEAGWYSKQMLKTKAFLSFHLFPTFSKDTTVVVSLLKNESRLQLREDSHLWIT